MAPAAIADAILRSSVAALTTRARPSRAARRPAIELQFVDGLAADPDPKFEVEEDEAPTAVSSAALRMSPVVVTGHSCACRPRLARASTSEEPDELMIVDHEYRAARSGSRA